MLHLSTHQTYEVRNPVTKCQLSRWAGALCQRSCNSLFLVTSNMARRHYLLNIARYSRLISSYVLVPIYASLRYLLLELENSMRFCNCAMTGWFFTYLNHAGQTSRVPSVLFQVKIFFACAIVSYLRYTWNPSSQRFVFIFIYLHKYSNSDNFRLYFVRQLLILRI